MTGTSLGALIRALNAGAVRYLIVGGLAVVAHGFVRFTADVDLILDFENGNLRRALDVLRTMHYRPRAPVSLDDFLSATNRAMWRRDKGMMVLSVFSDAHAATEVDIFTEIPIEFEAAYQRAVRLDVAPGVAATFVSLDDLIELKRRAGRPADILDIEKLEVLRRSRAGQ